MEYTVEEALAAILVCVVHKQCLQREITVEVNQEVLGIGMYVLQLVSHARVQ